MIRTYIDIEGVIHKYHYDTDNMTAKAKCNICHTKMNYIFVNKLRKHEKIGFICLNCNNVYVSSEFNLFKCRIITNLNKRID